MEIYNIILIWPAHEQSRDSICETQEQQKEVRRMKPISFAWHCIGFLPQASQGKETCNADN